MNEFSPTKKDLLLVESLILDIKTKKNKLISSKTSFENHLSQLKEKYKDVSHQSKDFKKIKTTRQNIKDHLAGIELKIKNLNDELNFKNKMKLEIEHYLKNHKSNDSEDVNKIINKLELLKKKYSDFAKDRTRIASLRVMANEIITEIDLIIKGI